MGTDPRIGNASAQATEHAHELVSENGKPATTDTGKEPLAWFVGENSYLKVLNTTTVTLVAIGAVLWGGAQIFHPHLLHFLDPPALHLDSEVKTFLTKGDAPDCVVYVASHVVDEGASPANIWGQRVTASLNANAALSNPAGIPNVVPTLKDLIYDDLSDPKVMHAAESGTLEPKEGQALWRAFRIPINKTPAGALVVNVRVIYGPQTVREKDMMICRTKDQPFGVCHHDGQVACTSDCGSLSYDRYHGAQAWSAMIDIPSCSVIGKTN